MMTIITTKFVIWKMKKISVALAEITACWRPAMKMRVPLGFGGSGLFNWARSPTLPPALSAEGCISQQKKNSADDYHNENRNLEDEICIVIRNS